MDLTVLFGRFKCNIGMHKFVEFAKFDRLTLEVECERCGERSEILDPDPPR